MREATKGPYATSSKKAPRPGKVTKGEEERWVILKKRKILAETGKGKTLERVGRLETHRDRTQ